MRLISHLLENRLRDVVIATPVSGALSVRELVHIVTTQPVGQYASPVVDLVGTVNEVATSTLTFDQRHLSGLVERATTATNGSSTSLAK